MSGFINGIFRVITIVSPKRGSFLPCVTWMSGAGRKYVRLSPIIDERPHSTATFILICHANYLDLEMTARSDNKNYQSSKNKLRKKTLAQDKGVNNDCTDRQGCRSRRKEFHKFTTVKYSLVLSQLVQRSYLKLWLRFFFGTVSVSRPNCSLLSIICLNETNFICLRFIYLFIFHQSKSTLVICMSGTYLISFFRWKFWCFRFTLIIIDTGYFILLLTLLNVSTGKQEEISLCHFERQKESPFRENNS